jgi:hypothetical protein
VFGSVGVRPARDLDTGGQHHVPLDVGPADIALRSDVGVFVDAQLRRGEQRAEADDGLGPASLARQPQECPAHVLTDEARDGGEKLARRLERAIPPDDPAAHVERDQRRQDGDGGDAARQRLHDSAPAR